MKRKEFIKKICLVGIGSAIGTNLPGCSILTNFSKYTVDGDLRSDGLYIPLDAFVHKSKALDYVIVHHEALQFPICVYRFSENDFSALWMECTHQGAELQVFGNKLECPAHGSEFGQRGTVENGPADRDLRRFPTEISNGQLKIKLI